MQLQATQCSSSGSLSGTPVGTEEVFISQFDWCFKVLISFTRYRETSPKRFGGEEREAKKISSKTQAQKIEYETQARKRSYETQAQRISSEKRRLAQEEIERFEEK